MKRLLTSLFMVIALNTFVVLNANALCTALDVVFGPAAMSECIAACGSELPEGICFFEDSNPALVVFYDSSCTDPCTPNPNPICGNGILEEGEQCDDGNLNSGDGCNSVCQSEGPPPALCGNGILEEGEECDDGNINSGDGCNSTCEEELPVEACEDLVTILGSQTLSTCIAACGEPLAEGSCFFDSNEASQILYRDSQCTSLCLGGPPPALCGNSIVEEGEQCDDGNLISGDGCSSVCQAEGPPPILCGNGVLNIGEQCDDGNLVGGDGCSAACENEIANSCLDLTEILGSGAIAECQSECGLSTCYFNPENPAQLLYQDSACLNLCGQAVCGNGILDEGEACDDANTVNGDGCNSICELELPANACSTAEDAELMFAVDDQGISHSKFFSFDPADQELNLIGDLAHSFDIEAMDAHPETAEIYALSGDMNGAVSSKKLLILDRVNGIPALEDGIQLDIGEDEEYIAASFNPSDNTLWAALRTSDGVELRIIDITNGSSSFVTDMPDADIEAIAWDNSGSLLYSSTRHHLITYDGNTFQRSCEIDEPVSTQHYRGHYRDSSHGVHCRHSGRDIFLARELEAMEFNSNGDLIVAGRSHHNGHHRNYRNQRESHNGGWMHGWRGHGHHGGGHDDNHGWQYHNHHGHYRERQQVFALDVDTCRVVRDLSRAFRSIPHYLNDIETLTFTCE